MSNVFPFHHHGFDARPDQEWIVCKCGFKMTNPFYQVGMNPVTRQPLIKGENK